MSDGLILLRPRKTLKCKGSLQKEARADLSVNNVWLAAIYRSFPAPVLSSAFPQSSSGLCALVYCACGSDRCTCIHACVSEGLVSPALETIIAQIIYFLG